LAAASAAQERAGSARGFDGLGLEVEVEAADDWIGDFIPADATAASELPGTKDTINSNPTERHAGHRAKLPLV
jgi:hypothetical protein